MPAQTLALLALCEAMATASFSTIPRLAKDARLLSPVEIEIERASTTGGGTIWSASLGGRWNGNRFDFAGDGASTNYDSNLTFVAVSNNNWLLKADKSTRTGTATTTVNSTTLTGAGTAFTTELAIGDQIQVNQELRTVVAITSATVLIVDRPFVSAIAGASVFLIDALLPYTTDFTVVTNAGVARVTFAAAAKGTLNSKFELHFVVPKAVFTYATATLQFKRMNVPGADVWWYVSDATATPGATNIYVAAADK